MNTGMKQIGARGLCMPPQVVSVDRKVVASALANDAGVAPSGFDFFRDVLGPIGQAVAPVVAQAAPSVLSGLLGMI